MMIEVRNVDWWINQRGLLTAKLLLTSVHNDVLSHVDIHNLTFHRGPYLIYLRKVTSTYCYNCPRSNFSCGIQLHKSHTRLSLVGKHFSIEIETFSK